MASTFFVPVGETFGALQRCALNITRKRNRPTLKSAPGSRVSEEIGSDEATPKLALMRIEQPHPPSRPAQFSASARGSTGTDPKLYRK